MNTLLLHKGKDKVRDGQLEERKTRKLLHKKPFGKFQTAFYYMLILNFQNNLEIQIAFVFHICFQIEVIESLACSNTSMCSSQCSLFSLLIISIIQIFFSI